MRPLFSTLFLFIGICAISISTPVFADKGDSVVTALNQKAIALCQGKKYGDAEKTFGQLFQIKGAVLPDEAAFYYGVTSFYLKKYKQARKAFNRFETLAQASDSLKKESLEYRLDMDCYEKGYFEYPEPCLNCEGKGHLVQTCQTCKGNGRQYCPVCSGTGVAVSKSSFGDNYSTCNRCTGKGVIDCLTCKGTGHVDQSCAVCKGKGVIMMKGICKDE
ncbi:MAG: dnaJ [Chitinophagaceae bacterium]|nr:dnaJ [Chitinophagaceae bacterium]